MKTVIIDNNLASITHLEVILEDIGLTTITGKYTCALKAIEEILEIRPSLIILDANLVELDGLTLAKRIENEMENIKIIFITSHGEYAVEAFELNQVDFILKPFKQARITQALNKLRPDYFKLNNTETHLVCSFKHLHYIELYQDGYFKEINLTWRTKFAKEIFAYFVTYRNVNVRKDVLIEMFWPGISVKKAYHNLYTNIYFIRKTLEEAELPILINNYHDHYKLEFKNIELDFELWLKNIERYKFVNISKLERAMDLYKGHFLQEESYLWAKYKTQKLRITWLEIMEYIIDEYVKEGNFHRAIINALYLQSLEPYLEETYYILMNLFAQIKDHGSIKTQYKELEKMLKEEYDIKPEKELKEFI